jgi:hypothetical protein
MTDYPAAIPLFAIQQLRCPKCRARMKLARTSPGPTGFELRRFNCSGCDHVEQIATPLDDPMKSDAVGWFTGELHPPTKAASGGDIDDRQCTMRFDDYRRRSNHRAARTSAVPVYVRGLGTSPDPASVGVLCYPSSAPAFITQRWIDFAPRSHRLHN